MAKQKYRTNPLAETKIKTESAVVIIKIIAIIKFYCTLFDDTQRETDEEPSLYFCISIRSNTVADNVKMKRHFHNS